MTIYESPTKAARATYDRPLWNKTLILATWPILLTFGALSVWCCYTDCVGISGVVLLVGVGVAIIIEVAYVIDGLVKRLEEKRTNIVLLDQQLLKMGRLAVSAKVIRDFLGNVKDMFINIDSAAEWGRKLIDQNNAAGLADVLAQIKAESARAHQSIDKVLNFTQPPENRWLIQDIDINRLVLDILEVFTGELAEYHIRISRSLEKPLPKIRSNFSRLCQVIENMLAVVVADIRPDGELTIKTKTKGDGIEIQMMYPSRHFDRNVLTRLSDPAYALQSRDSGTYLALTMYHIERLGGRFNVDVTGAGLQFIITLPLRMNFASSHPPQSFLKGL